MKTLLSGIWIAALGILPAVSAPLDDPGRLGMVAIGSPNNPADVNGCGKVPYTYRIAKDPIDNKTYVEFLNAVDPDGANDKSLYNPKMMLSPEGGITFDNRAPLGRRYQVKPGAARNPVAFVNWADAARFANWLSNGAQEGSSTEVGAYNLRESDGRITERQAGSRFSLPTQDEIYKAAFFLPAGSGRSNSDELYVPPAERNLLVALGAISIPIVSGVVNELVDPYDVNGSGPEWEVNNDGLPDTFRFAGQQNPNREDGVTGFRMVSVTRDEYAENDEDAEEYAGAPDFGNTFFTPAFPIPFASFSGSGSGSGAGTGNTPSADLPPSS